MMAFLFLSGFVLSLFLFSVGRKIALRAGFVDRPGVLKTHEGGVPPIGGLVILPVFAALSWLGGFQDIVPLSLLLGLFAVLVMGALDDAFILPAWVRFVLQFAVSVFIVVVGGVQLHTMGNLLGFGEIYPGWFSVPFTIMCFMVLMNALNMMDGLDGLSGGYCAGVVFLLILACGRAGLWNYVVVLSFLLAPLLAFLVFNMRHPWRRKASIFIGDSGALALALLLGWFCITLSQSAVTGQPAALAPVSIIWLLAVPVMDLFALFFVRLRRRQHPFEGDRDHLHHRILDRGISPEKATPLILVVAAFLGLVGLAGFWMRLPEAALFGLWVFILLAYTFRGLKKYGRKN